jgi:ABC-2 type transport system permease protein
MNIYMHEFRNNLRSVFIWSASLALLLLTFMSLSPGLEKSSAVLSAAMANFPKELLIAFGMTTIDWSSILGFFGIVFLFCQICLAIQAANYGFGMVSIEEAELTADFLLAKPVGRAQILTDKFLAAFSSLTLTNIVVWVCSFGFINLFASGKAYDAKALVMLLLSIAVFQLFFLTVGVVVSLMVKRVRSVTPFSMGLVFGLYILNAFGGMIGSTSLEVISPFKHFNPNYILENAAFDLPLVMISVVVILVSIAGSYVLYSKRNIPSAV